MRVRCRVWRRWLAAGCGVSGLLWATLVAGEPRAAIWQADVPGVDAAWVRELGTMVHAAQYAVEWLDSAALTNVTQLSPGRFDLLVVPDARRLPIESVGSITRFLKGGGDLLALGLTAWETPSFRLGDRWLSQAGYDAELAKVASEHALLDLVSEDVSRWARHTNRRETESQRSVAVEAGTPVLHVRMASLEGWDVVEPPARAWTFGDGQTLTCFRARGGRATRQLAVEWIEKDGSRWIATVDLAPGWRSYALPPESFRPWQPPTGRGGPGDRVNLNNLARFTVGLALTHTAVDPGPQEYWFGGLGTAKDPFQGLRPPAGVAVPRLESLSPGYQVYPIPTPVDVRLVEGQDGGMGRYLGTMEVKQPAAIGLAGLHPRPGGAGWAQDRDWRWQPLMEAYGPKDGGWDYRGAVAAMLVHERGEFAGGVWTLVASAERDFCRHFVVQHALKSALARMRDGLFLGEGGAEFYTLFPGQAVRLGARVVNQRAEAQAATTQLRIRVDSANGRTNLAEQKWEVIVGAGERVERGFAWTPPTEGGAGWRVTVECSWEGRVIDRLAHELRVWQPKPDPEYLEARDGGFWLGGKPWKAHGVNYMPSSGIGVVGAAFEYWMGRGAYDPVVIQRDLERVKGMGLNAVNVFLYYRDLGAQHLLDFLDRCERLGLRVNLSLRPGTPMEFRWAEVRAMIEHYRLAANDTVMAYDLAWEPSHYDHRHQVRQYTAPWREWVARRYGSTPSAMAAWGRPAAGWPEWVDGAGVELQVPPMKWLITDGDWRRVVADYRAFLDDLLHEKYAEARRLVRSVDPHHPVSFRMQHAGDPTYLGEGMLPYDMVGLKGAVDIWEPEAYGRIGGWEQVKPGHFTAAYARSCDPGLPVVWAEMGYTVWDLRAMAPHPARLAAAAQFYEDFYRMMIESGADGVFFWWYPGGFRANEQSDFGIVNPDGTDRPVTEIIRSAGARFLAAPKPGPVDRWMDVDRDRDARGIAGIYEAVKREYWQAVEAGGRPGLRWPSK